MTAKCNSMVNMDRLNFCSPCIQWFLCRGSNCEHDVFFSVCFSCCSGSDGCAVIIDLNSGLGRCPAGELDACN